MDNDADDSQRMDLYENLLCRTYRVAADLDISWRCKNVGFYISQFSKAAHINMSPSFVRTVLETYVSDMAMLSSVATTTTVRKRGYRRPSSVVHRASLRFHNCIVPVERRRPQLLDVAVAVADNRYC